MIATGPKKETHTILGGQNAQGFDFVILKHHGASLALNPTESSWHIYRTQTHIVVSGRFQAGEQVSLLTNSVIRHTVLSEHISWAFNSVQALASAITT